MRQEVFGYTEMSEVQKQVGLRAAKLKQQLGCLELKTRIAKQVRHMQNVTKLYNMLELEWYSQHIIQHHSRSPFSGCSFVSR